MNNRLILKTLSWATLHVVVAATVVYALTGDLAIAVGVGLIEPLVQTVVYAIHERVWEGPGPRARFQSTSLVTSS